MKCITCKHDGRGYCGRGYSKSNAGKLCRGHERMKLYICGRISGETEYRLKFLLAEERLFKSGYYPVNPAACVPGTADWPLAMRQAIRLMLRCDGVALLPDWEESRGAKIEEALARELGMDVRPIGEWE